VHIETALAAEECGSAHCTRLEFEIGRGRGCTAAMASNYRRGWATTAGEKPGSPSSIQIYSGGENAESSAWCIV
jgi:hypothetical protein